MAAGARDPPHPYPRPQRFGAVPLISVFDLRNALAGTTPLTLLDVRPAAERAVARFPVDRWIPLPELPRRLAEVPANHPVVAYDQFGAKARQAAQLLGVAGRDAAALEGGLDEYARLIDPTIPRYPAGLADGAFELRQLPRAETGCLAYFLGDPTSHEAVLIDPGHDVTPYLALLKTEPWHLTAILETHTHADHLAGHAALHQRTDAPIYVSRRSPAAYPHRPLAEGDQVEFGGTAIEVLETPGHTRDHLSLRVRDKVLTGDTLLLGSCGRTDLGDGSPELLWGSLTEKLLCLPDETEVLPAHYGAHHALPDRYASSIGFERATNEALGQGSLDAFVRYMTEGWPPKPSDFDQIVHENLAAF
ncbi:MAG: MBL fold metallo-hydrolase [Thermoplasmata archaeon]|nr:MBL fold metallo-hydrolase [Thermoplasmata archaeon]